MRRKKMKVKLNLKERLVLLDLLPQKGTITEQITAKAVIKKVEITSDEIDKWDIREERQGGGNILVWSEKKAEELEYDFNKAEIRLLEEGVDRLDKEGNITQRNLDLCQKVKNL